VATVTNSSPGEKEVSWEISFYDTIVITLDTGDRVSINVSNVPGQVSVIAAPAHPQGKLHVLPFGKNAVDLSFT
jgi:hypothetical protein